MTYDPANVARIIEANEVVAESGVAELWIPGPLPCLNDFVRKHYRVYSKLKQQWNDRISLLARGQGFPPISGGVFNYEIREYSRRRDPSNIAAGAIKIIEDALQKAGLLENDGWLNIKGLHTTWKVDAHRPGVYLVVEDCELWEEEQHVREQKGQVRFGAGAADHPRAPKANSHAARRRAKARARLLGKRGLRVLAGGASKDAERHPLTYEEFLLLEKGREAT